MSTYLLQGGLYGDSKTIVSLRHARKGGSLGYILSRIFLPFNELSAEYPVLLRKKWLYPIYQVVRWWDLLVGGKAGYWLRRLRNNAAASGADSDTNARLLADLGLWE